MQLLEKFCKLILVLTFVGTSLVSCSSSQKLERDTFYEHTLHFEIDKKKRFLGVGVLDPHPYQLISIRNKRSDLDYVVLTSNHRNVTVEDEGSSWKYKFHYSKKVESGLVRVKGFNKEGKHTWGAFAIRDEQINLKAKVYCNGRSYEDSTIFCQSKENLLQYIEFKNEVIISQEDNTVHCAMLTPESFTELQFEIGKGFCVYTFTELKSGHQMELHTYGFELALPSPSGK